MQAVRDDSAAADSGVPHAEALLAWTDATVQQDEAAVARTRERVLAETGAAATVDAAAIIGNFERMTRIADATGIPLDAPVNVLASELQRDLGLREFRSAQNTTEPNAWVAGLASLLQPVVLRLMPVMAKLIRARS